MVKARWRSVIEHGGLAENHQTGRKRPLRGPPGEAAIAACRLARLKGLKTGAGVLCELLQHRFGIDQFHIMHEVEIGIVVRLVRGADNVEDARAGPGDEGGADV